MSFSIKKAGLKSSSVVPSTAIKNSSTSKPNEQQSVNVPLQPHSSGISIRRSITLNENYR